MLTRKAPAAISPHTRSFLHILVRLWPLVLLLATCLVLFLNLPYAPRTWFDEGSHLHVPKTLVQHGVYADISSEGFRYYGPTVGVGPTVMLPIALMFNLFDVGITQGRLVIVLYALVALASLYALGQKLHGHVAGLLVLTLLFASRTFNYEGFIEYSRQVLGETPGLAFLSLGLLAWVAALHAGKNLVTRRSWLLSVLAGLGFGLALVTKNQFVLIIPVALVAVGVLDWLYYRVGTWQLRIVPVLIACGCFGLWVLAQFQFLGPGSFLENMQQTRQAAGGAIFVFDMGATLRAGKYLLQPDLYGGLLIPALLYAAWRARRRDAQGLSEALLVIIIGLWLTWFVGASLGWPRYAFPAVALGALLIARALIDLLTWLRNGTTVQRALAVLGTGYAALFMLVPFALSTNAIVHPDDTAHRFAAYLDDHVPQDTVVETWEPELGVLTDHRYHYPPIELLDTAVRHQWLGGPPLVYDGLQDAPVYVVVGSFGGYTGIYDTVILEQKYMEEHSIGSYVLFRRR
ncbi:MAG: phospholipid carrier-dependent glycosyltransferase [Chloroflexi bacterium AL-W]|nr:phospholipid carrier-dependent glycosyltransferase [Chloroflexi bacterium AL-N1]NOK69791.1 phospholipid carrier-dependent glycosyltransferase [Chloroflexi bacterium AL-N10]NOK73605.1 phospholipid carrier-dependent glycosyltransferase [Chloroflexi bacterium AL-N5]NOK83961.1 phospholipid carrier-dependent glycosyltransferase [Chloroflexi bacterium AL-W]NOK87936.1 phospholipid carrier-dependent glycosyltransferase [Chloroflexi bacterium AL-N15]